MSKSHSSSTKSHASWDSTFSQTSQRTYQTDLTSCNNTRPSMKHYDTAPVYQQILQQKQDFFDEGIARSSCSSINTYASTEASDEEPASSLEDFPSERQQCFEPDTIPSTPSDFAELYPSVRRLMIQHDDSTMDGNQNLRVDTDVVTRSGRKRKMTLFYLRMTDISERKFSLRRYWRNSGREVANSKRKYVAPIFTGHKPNMKRSSTAPELRPTPQRQDSGYESDDDDLLEQIKQFNIANDVKATIPTDDIRLEFSNYAQVNIEPVYLKERKQYNFEYWGDNYAWRRRALADGDEIINSYELINLKTRQKISSIVPDALSPEESSFEAAQGAWIPASSMRLLVEGISDDLADVIMATGLVALTDDSIPR